MRSVIRQASKGLDWLVQEIIISWLVPSAIENEAKY